MAVNRIENNRTNEITQENQEPQIKIHSKTQTTQSAYNIRSAHQTTDRAMDVTKTKRKTKRKSITDKKHAEDKNRNQDGIESLPEVQNRE